MLLVIYVMMGFTRSGWALNLMASIFIRPHEDTEIQTLRENVM